LDPSFSRCDDFVGVGFPDEGFGLAVVVGDEAVDGDLQIDEGMEASALQSPAGELSEEALDRVEP
jgi:hypothetical protein